MILRQLNATLMQYSIVLRLHFEWDCITNDCMLSLSLRETEGVQQVSLRFEKVAELSLQHLGGGITQFISLHGEDIRARQMEGMNYRLRDEYDRVAFYCHSFCRAN